MLVMMAVNYQPNIVLVSLCIHLVTKTLNDLFSINYYAYLL
jgi:hypothetical protein